ncbi:MAG: hypothetical protein Q9184_007122 [Pyrenodesmia sp. 2 TL-2023]
MISTPPLHLRSALQSFKLQSHIIRPYHARTSFLPSKPHPRSTARPLRPQPHPPAPTSLQTLRFASDTSTHPASSHPSASSPAASNPASVPPGSPSSSSSPTSTSNPASPSQTNPQTNSAQPTSSSFPTSPPASNRSTITTTTTTSSSLTWNDYLSLRKSRRHYSLVSSLLTSSGATIAGLSLIQTNFDTITATLHSFTGVDPIFMLAVATVATAGAGWLLGPVVGEALFRVVYRKQWGRMGEKEKDFYNRIRRHRVDPSLASYSNPLPDYYGEKIGSVKEYRTWLRDQRAYLRKRNVV